MDVRISLWPFCLSEEEGEVRSCGGGDCELGGGMSAATLVGGGGNFGILNVQ